MNIGKQMSQIEHLELLVSSLRLENEKLKKDIHNIKKMYTSKIKKLQEQLNAEYMRAELLQKDLDDISDFEYETEKALKRKMN